MANIIIPGKRDLLDESVDNIIRDVNKGNVVTGEGEDVLWLPQQFYKGFRVQIGKVYGKYVGIAVEDNHKITFCDEIPYDTENECGRALLKYIDAYRGLKNDAQRPN